jgi:glycosyltransferase involved in cell wall biosynthesis
MRVIQVMAGGVHGGAESAFEDITLALSEAGIEQAVIVRNNNQERIQKFKDAHIPVYTLPFSGILDVYTPWQIKKIIADFKPQIVQTWMSRATHKTPSPKSPKTYLKVARLGGYYGLKYYKGTDYFIANTPDIEKYLVKEGVSRGQVKTLYNFAPEEKPQRIINKSDVNTPQDAPVILSLARYHHAKALDVLIQGLVFLPDVHLWLAGDGPLKDDLMKLAASLEVSDRVHFLGWRTDRAELFAACDMCVFPSRFEPFGNVVVQAWAQRKPLVCSKSQGPLQYVRDGQDALMFDIDDVQAMVTHIKTILNNQGLANSLVSAGYDRYQHEFTKERVVKNYIDYYQEIVAREGLPR